jgi:sugar/nucleoside kinase (ribokinase family)
MGGAPNVILVVGDVIDDIVVRPVGPPAARTDTPAQIAERPGGSGANTAAWLGALGAPVRFVGRVGQADVRRHAHELERFGVEARLAVDPRVATGRIVILAHDRSMFTDRGAGAALGPEDLPDALLDGVTHIHVSGYSLVEERPRRAVLDLVERADLPWSVDPASAAFVRGTAFLGWTAGASVCLPNEDEAAILGDGLLEPYEVVVLKRGPRGARMLRRGAPPLDVGAAPVDVADLTGAGDAFAAGFLAARLRGDDDATCLALAVDTAAQALQRVGGRPG